MNSTFSCWSEGRAYWPVLFSVTILECITNLTHITSSENVFSLIISIQTVGLESPTHALRADADPSAQSASATYITLAQEHPYDRHIEIILHLSGKQH